MGDNLWGRFTLSRNIKVSLHFIDKLKSMLINGKTYKDNNIVDSTVRRLIQFQKIIATR